MRTVREPIGMCGEPCGVCGIGGAMIDLIELDVCRHWLRLPTWSARQEDGDRHTRRRGLKGYGAACELGKQA